jgi:uncharacterized protein (TIGR02246 family)
MTNTSTDTSTPEDTIRHFSRYVREQDLENLIALYEPEALFVPDAGNEVKGRDALRAMYGGLFSIQPRMEVSIVASHRTGELAFVANEWTLTGTAPDGTTVTKSGRSAVVLRLQPNGAWLIAIDRP